jgi:GMP synthase-like glutamine amidotransferase
MSRMRLHYLQHVAFEGPASIERWAASRRHALTATRFYLDDVVPDLRDIDWLVVLGGPMNVYQENEHPWLRPEKAFITQAIEAGKTVLGICLGAQLIADVLGAQVHQGKHQEIGWFPIELTEEAKRSEIFGFLPGRLTVFHWHGDTFGLPPGAVRLARSEGCENQAFLYQRRVIGLQFHFESTPESVREIVQNCGHEIVPARFAQDAQSMLAARTARFTRINTALFGILDRLAAHNIE